MAKPFSRYNRLELSAGYRSLAREQEGTWSRRLISSIGLGLVHDSVFYQGYDPRHGSRCELSFLRADRILGGSEDYSILQAQAQSFFDLDFLLPWSVLAARVSALAAIGQDHPNYLYGGLGFLPGSLMLRGYPLGSLLGSQMASLSAELRFPIARNINFPVWPLTFFILKEFHIALFDDCGFVTTDVRTLQQYDLRNGYGAGMRMHFFVLGKQLFTLRFDAAQRTDRTGDPIYTVGLGQSF
jgi:outer membrane protein assembly factor BamA